MGWRKSLGFADLALHHVAFLFAARRLLAGGAALCGWSLLRVQLLAQGVAGLLPLFGQLADLLEVIGLDGLAQLLNAALDPLPICGGHFVSQLAQGLLGLVDQAVAVVAGLGQLPALAVLALVRLAFLHHALPIALVQVGGGSDGARLLLPGGLVLGAHVEDPVGV